MRAGSFSSLRNRVFLASAARGGRWPSPSPSSSSPPRHAQRRGAAPPRPRRGGDPGGPAATPRARGPPDHGPTRGRPPGPEGRRGHGRRSHGGAGGPRLRDAGQGPAHGDREPRGPGAGRGGHPAGRGGSAESAVREALLGREAIGFSGAVRACFRWSRCPWPCAPQAPEVVGTLSLGLALDASLARDLRGVTESEVAFGCGDRRHRHEPARGRRRGPRPGASARDARRGATWRATSTSPSPGPAVAAPTGRVFVVLRSRTERLRFLEPLRTALLAAAAAAVLGAVVLSFMVSRTVTRPLAEITDAMREIARTGDFTRKIPAGTDLLRRGRARAGLGLQHPPRLGGALPARGRRRRSASPPSAGCPP